MLRLEWSASHAVYVTEVDDEHREIFEALSALDQSLATEGPRSGIGKQAQALAAHLDSHFGHEERLMRAARYGSFRWHKRSHDNARKRVTHFMRRLKQGDAGAAPELIEYLTNWLHDHTRLADMMMGAYLRNRRRGLYKVTFRSGTKPVDACEWVNSDGDKFDPRSIGRGDRS